MSRRTAMHGRASEASNPRQSMANPAFGLGGFMGIAEEEEDDKNDWFT